LHLGIECETARLDRACEGLRNLVHNAKLILQSLLADRFKLVVRKEDRPLPAFNLTVGKGKPKLKESDGTGETGCKSRIDVPPGAGSPDAAPVNISSLMIVYTCKNMSMEAFIATMRNIADTPGNNPVMDKTELKGAWDFEFKFSLALRALGAGDSSGATSFADALDKQLGLKLDPIKIPQSVIVVESALKTPTPNSSDITKAFPAASLEFDVAEIKPSAPPAAGPVRLGLQIQPSGRVNVTGMPLRTLILQAWGIGADMLVGAPKFVETDRYDIIAKAPANSILAGVLPENAPAAANPPMDTDTVWAMIRQLITERFQIKAHMEERPATAYDLVAVKPKMKKADPSSRTKFTEGPGADGKDPRNANPAAGRLVTVQNMTMAQLGEKLQYIAGGYIHSPVLDKTGLEGGYDFTLSFSAAGMVNGGGRAGGVVVFSNGGGQVTLASGPGGGGSDPSDPNGAISLFDAMEKQLGIKLVEVKRPVSVLVIDHIEQKPIDN
jgi:uncharacterized protein (TIGR03435 family)